jgi:transposase
MNALAEAHDAAVQMIDTSIVRVHQHGACITRNKTQSMGRSRGGLTSKIHAVVDTNGLPLRLALTAGEAQDNRLAGKLLSRLKSGTMLLADRGYDERRYASVRIFTALATWSSGSSTRLSTVGAWQPATTSSRANYLAFVQLASIRLWLRVCAAHSIRKKAKARKPLASPDSS